MGGCTKLNGMDRFRGDVGGVCLAGEFGRECHSLMYLGMYGRPQSFEKSTSDMELFLGSCMWLRSR